MCFLSRFLRSKAKRERFRTSDACSSQSQSPAIMKSGGCTQRGLISGETVHQTTSAAHQTTSTTTSRSLDTRPALTSATRCLNIPTEPSSVYSRTKTLASSIDSKSQKLLNKKKPNENIRGACMAINNRKSSRQSRKRGSNVKVMRQPAVTCPLLISGERVQEVL